MLSPRQGPLHICSSICRTEPLQYWDATGIFSYQGTSVAPLAPYGAVQALTPICPFSTVPPKTTLNRQIFRRTPLPAPPITGLRQWKRMCSCVERNCESLVLIANLGLFPTFWKRGEDQSRVCLLLPAGAPPWTSGGQNKGPLLR